MLIKESVEVHDELNPKIWKDNKLDTEVKNKLLEIVEEFKEYIDIPISIADVHILGSNAGFNYHEGSDLDLHLVVNFDMIPASDEILQALYNAKKSSFNDTFDINIRGIPVEVYVEDIKANTVSNGIYSLTKDMWIKYPKKEDIPDVDVNDMVSKFNLVIQDAMTSNNLDKMKCVLDSIYLLRKNSLACGGEYSKGNQTFKALRNQGSLEELRNRIYDETSKELSLERFLRR